MYLSWVVRLNDAPDDPITSLAAAELNKSVNEFESDKPPHARICPVIAEEFE
jgi:hypothetical protein